MNIPFVGGGVNARRALSANSEFCLNFYPEIAQSGDKSQMRLVGTPGLDRFTYITDNSSACRGFFVSSAGTFYAVIGGTLYSIGSAGIYSELGTLLTGAGYVNFAENVNITTNTTQIMIVDNSYGYIFDVATLTLTRITDGDYTTGSHVIYKDGYFIQNKKSTNQFIYSNLYDGLNWQALNYYAAEGNSDNITATETINNDIWLFGEKSIEAYYPTGVSTSPFARSNGSYSDIGIIAPYSLSKINNTLFWLGKGREGNHQIYALNSYSPQKISNHNIEYFLSTLTSPSTAKGFCYQQEGHVFYMLSFPDDDKTICFDMSTNMWHERGYYNSQTGYNNIHRAICCENFNNKVVVGDYNNSNIYYLDLDTYDDYNNEIVRIRQTNHIGQDRKRVFYNNFELDMEVGQGLLSGQGSDPQVMLTYSNDGGNTWSNEYFKSAGKLGEYKTRVRWTRLGQARDRVFRVRVSDPVKWVINSAHADITVEGV